MRPAFFAFFADERGAITVDWTLVAAAGVGMALAAIALVGGSAQHSSAQTSGAMSGYEIDASFDSQSEIAALFISIEPAEAVD
jgi:Flp pilus assembly pilin Flp